jgi:hypothetical protein
MSRKVKHGSGGPQAVQRSLLDYVDADRRSANPTRWEAAAKKAPAVSVNGPGYVREWDEARLNGQMKRVYDACRDGKWRTLHEITTIAQPGGEASISAQLRALRKPEHGRHTVNRRRVGDPTNGLFEYQLIINRK